MKITNTLANFYCGVCEAPFDTRQERESHKLTHDEYYAEIAAGRARRAKRDATGANLPVGISETPKPLPRGSGGSNGLVTHSGPTEKQMAFIESLCEERQLDSMPRPATKKGASETIEQLLAMPRPQREAKSKPPAITSMVPAGYYALDGSGKNETVFYRVDMPTQGRWEGYTFVKLVVGGHPDHNIPRSGIAGILARIEAADITQATVRYGQEIGRCGVCNRTLTDDESRAAGIGPVCRNK